MNITKQHDLYVSNITTYKPKKFYNVCIYAMTNYSFFWNKASENVILVSGNKIKMN